MRNVVKADTYQEAKVDIGAQDWAEDDWDDNVCPVIGDIVDHEERKRCHGWQQELEGSGSIDNHLS